MRRAVKGRRMQTAALDGDRRENEEGGSGESERREKMHHPSLGISPSSSLPPRPRDVAKRTFALLTHTLCPCRPPERLHSPVLGARAHAKKLVKTGGGGASLSLPLSLLSLLSPSLILHTRAPSPPLLSLATNPPPCSIPPTFSRARRRSA
jgi:hypothetical protein